MINLQLFKSYIKHQLKAKTRHGVHSPFVYKLVDEIIYNYSEKEDYQQIEQLRSQLSVDERSITITDLGAGSHVSNKKQKKVKELTRNALKPPKLAQLIYRLADERQPENIVELGTCLGLTTAYLAKAVPTANVISIEGCPQTAGIAKENLLRLNLSNVEVLTGNFDSIFPEIVSEMKKVDFVFIDGNHRKQATLDYFHGCLSKVHEDSLLIFDDIYWSKDMQEAWQEIKAHPQVRVTVDLFWIGLVYFRKGQAKEDFRIKFSY